MDSSADKLAQGLQRLKQAGDNRDLLGGALLSLHGALEDHFRAWLAAQREFPADQRALLANRQQASWEKLLEWMQRYGRLGDDVARQIRQANRLRQEVAHGGSYSGTRGFLDGYAALVERLCGDTYRIASPPKRRAVPGERPQNGRAVAAGRRQSPARAAPRTERSPASPKIARPASGPAGAAPRPGARKARSARVPRRRADAPPPWPVGFVARFMVILIVVLIVYVALRLAM